MLDYIHMRYDSFEDNLSENVKAIVVKGWKKHQKDKDSKIVQDDLMKIHLMVNKKHYNFYRVFILGGGVLEDLTPIKRGGKALKSWLNNDELKKYNQFERENNE